MLVEEDDEKNRVLQFQGSASRAFKPAPNFRVVVGMDRHKASVVDSVIATAGDSPDATRWLVRIDARKGVAFGKQVGGVFEPVGETVPFPQPKEGQTPYLELRYQRAGGALAAWFDTQYLGQAPAGDLRTNELRIEATGGPVRIEFAEFVELVEKR